MSELIRNSGVYQRLTSSTKELERLFTEVDEKKTPPDIKKVLLLMGLGTLSWISTYSGLLELIKANSGDIAFTYKLAIGFAVAMLMLMIVYILDQLFAPLNWLLRTIYIFGYIFLTIISVGFGFGFYWKFLESRSEATRSAESAITQVQGTLQAGQTRLEQLEQTLTSLTALSLQKAKEEREQGNSCPNSRPGDGPRRRLRDQDAKNFSFAGDFVTKRAQSVANDINRLNGDMTKISTRHPSTIDPTTGTRNAFLKTLNQQLDMTITRFNAFRTDPQLQAIRNNLAQRANTTIFPNGTGGTFKCPDAQLQAALQGVVLAIDQLPTVQKPKISAVEGSEATIEAFRRLGATLNGLLVFKLPPSGDELRELRQKAVRSVNEKKKIPTIANTQPGLNERDYIPLAIAIFVDFCLLLVSINRPMDRLKSLVPVMKDARDGPISGILSSFHATHFAGIREEFSLFQHVVFDWGGHYYVAVPLASNDIQAQYLANLFVSLEGRGIVDRAMIPPGFIIRSKLKKMGSSFAGHRAFRLYKFRNGAWSNIVMDAVMGAAKDVSIATAQHQADHQLNQPDQNTHAHRNPNFASMFEAEKHPLSTQHTVAKDQQGPSQTGLDNNQPIIEMPRLLRTAKSNRNTDDHNNNIITPSHFNHPSSEGQPKSAPPYNKKANPPQDTNTPSHQPKHQTGPDNDTLNKRATHHLKAPALKSPEQGKRDIISMLKQSGDEKALIETCENETNTKQTEQTVSNDQDKKQPTPPLSAKERPKTIKQPAPITENQNSQGPKNSNQEDHKQPKPQSEIAVGKITDWFAQKEDEKNSNEEKV